MRQWHEVKVRTRLGFGDQDDKRATLLCRGVQWVAWRISREANPQYRESVLEALGLKEDSKTLTTPGTKDAERDDDLPPKVFGTDRKFRPIVATINFMATDMPDLLFACVGKHAAKWQRQRCSCRRRSNATATAIRLVIW